MLTCLVAALFHIKENDFRLKFLGRAQGLLQGADDIYLGLREEGLGAWVGGGLLDNENALLSLKTHREVSGVSIKA